MRALVVEPLEASLEVAIGKSAALLEITRADRAIAVMATAIRPGPTVVLGALQSAVRVVDERSLGRPGSMPVLRRATTGTGFVVDGGVMLSISLPYLDAAFDDATPRTVLNRNLRLVMRGLAKAGIDVAYLGREWLAWKRRPVAVLGLAVEADGCVLIEVFLSRAARFVVPPGTASDLEASCDRYRGRVPVTLDECAPQRSDAELLEPWTAGCIERLGLPCRQLTNLDPTSLPEVVVTSPTSPLLDAQVPPRWCPPQAVPIGYIDVAKVGPATWIGGDLLGPAFALGLGFPPPTALDQLPLEGALWDDVRRVYDAAR